jgi:hypothetical protein
VFNAVDEIDPWLEHTRSPSAVARAYRDYVFARCSQAGVQLNDDECQLVQVWFGASQWSGKTSSDGGGGGGGDPGGGIAAAAAELPRRFPPQETGLPAPGSGATGLPDFTLPEHERETASQPAKPSPLRYSFLKHG